MGAHLYVIMWAYPTHNRHLSMGFYVALYMTASSLALLPMHGLSYCPSYHGPWLRLAGLACVGAQVEATRA